MMELYINNDDPYKHILKESKPIPEGKPLSPEMNNDLRCILTVCFMIQPPCIIHVHRATTVKQACDRLTQVY
jgi:hypothetical protein